MKRDRWACESKWLIIKDNWGPSMRWGIYPPYALRPVALFPTGAQALQVFARGYEQ